MLRFDQGVGKKLCDGISRRRFLEVGSLSAFGLSLSSLLRCQQDVNAADGSGRGSKHASNRSVILVWQHGGPSQLDTFDMKPFAPAEVRGPYRPIASALPGLDVCELCPEQAKVMDKCTVVRSFTHGNADHWAAAHWMLTGRLGANGSDRVPRQPSMGAVASHLLGPRQSGVLTTINMNDGGFGFNGGAWLGVAHNPFRYGEFSYGDEAGRLPSGDHKSFGLVEGLTSGTLSGRVELRSQFDTYRKRLDQNATFRQMDHVDRQALDILMSGRMREAFDVSSTTAPFLSSYLAFVARRVGVFGDTILRVDFDLVANGSIEGLWFRPRFVSRSSAGGRPSLRGC